MFRQEAENARDAGIRLVAVPVGNEVDLGEMSGIADNPDSSNLFTMATAEDIVATAARVLDELCLI